MKLIYGIIAVEKRVRPGKGVKVHLSLPLSLFFFFFLGSEKVIRIIYKGKNNRDIVALKRGLHAFEKWFNMVMGGRTPGFLSQQCFIDYWCCG